MVQNRVQKIRAKQTDDNPMAKFLAILFGFSIICLFIAIIACVIIDSYFNSPLSDIISYFVGCVILLSFIFGIIRIYKKIF